MSFENRLKQLNSHFITQSTKIATKSITIGDEVYTEVIDYAPRYENKLDYFNKQGWGYADSVFERNDKTGKLLMTGNKYLYSGKVLPNIADWIEANVSGIDFNQPRPRQDDMEIDPPKHVNH